jgi:hypothetical protein
MPVESVVLTQERVTMSDKKFSHAGDVEFVQHMVADALAKAFVDLAASDVERGKRLGFIVKRLDSAITQAMDAIALTSKPMISGPSIEQKKMSLSEIFEAEFMEEQSHER